MPETANQNFVQEKIIKEEVREINIRLVSHGHLIVVELPEFDMDAGYTGDEARDLVETIKRAEEESSADDWGWDCREVKRLLGVYASLANMHKIYSDEEVMMEFEGEFEI